jgi:hypothetical protein
LVGVRAAALVSPMPMPMPMPMTVKVEDILAGAEEKSYEAPGVTGSAGGDGPAWIVAECADGLDRQVREVPQMYVTADVDLPVPGKGEQRRDLMDFRTAVRVANGITGRQKCGGSPLAEPTRMIDTYEADVTEDPDGSNIRTVRVDEPGLGAKKCRGLGRRTGFPGNWTAVGDLQNSRLLNVCKATTLDRKDWTETDPMPQDAVTDVSAASWAGELGRSAVEQYDYTGDSYGFASRKGAVRRPSVRASRPNSPCGPDRHTPRATPTTVSR